VKYSQPCSSLVLCGEEGGLVVWGEEGVGLQSVESPLPAEQENKHEDNHRQDSSR